MRNQLLQLLRITRFAHTRAIPNAVPAGSGRKKSYALVVAGFGIGTGVGCYLGVREYQRRKSTNVAVLNSNENDGIYLLNSAPDFPASRSIRFPCDRTGLKLTLYQYQTCPFCCKVRAVLDFLGISYDIVEVNPVLRTQLKWSDKYKKVPILIVQTPTGEILQLNDSSMIISALYSYVNGISQGISNEVKTSKNKEENSSGLLQIVKCYPNIQFKDDGGYFQSDILNKYHLMADGLDGSEGAVSRTKEDVMEERKWRKWADSVYVHTLSPNIYRTIPEAIDSFKNFDKVGEWERNFSSWERSLVIYVGALAMWGIGKKLQRRHRLKQDVRQSLYDESNYWLRSIKQKGNGDFMGGSKPNLSDLAVYGVLSSIEGCAAFDDLTENSKIVSQWYSKVKQHLRTKNISPGVEVTI